MSQLSNDEQMLLDSCMQRRIEELQRELRYGGYAKEYMDTLPGEIAALIALRAKFGP